MLPSVYRWERATQTRRCTRHPSPPEAVWLTDVRDEHDGKGLHHEVYLINSFRLSRFLLLQQLPTRVKEGYCDFVARYLCCTHHVIGSSV